MRERIVLAGVLLIALAVGARAQEVFGGAPILAGQATILAKGEAVLDDGQVTVELPAWFESQAKPSGRVVILTCRNGHSPLSAGPVVSGRFAVTTNQLGDQSQAFCWVVIADRKL